MRLLHHNDVNPALWECEYKNLLNKEDPLDQLILDLAEKGKLKVGIVGVKEERWRFFKKYMPNFLSHLGKHTL